jgi:23S rRNA (uracil1939-C5)-methyltransferase
MPVERLHIDSIAAGGDGVARAEGMVVFVPRTAPGDVAQVSYTPKGRFARGTVLSLDTPSAHRVSPACEHYDGDRCGGCQLQHLDYDAQRSAKGEIVRDAMVRIARRADAAAPEVRPAAPWRYRRKLTLALRARGGGHGWTAGLHPYDDPAHVFALRECPITEDRVLAAWREVLEAGDSLPNATELRAAVRFDDAGAGSLVVEGGDRWSGAKQLLERAPSLESIWWKPARAPRAGCAASRADASSPAAAFAQVNAAVAAALGAYVVDRVLSHAPATVVDAYAGTGHTAIALASNTRRVVAIELDADASAWCAARLPNGSRAVAARVEDALPAALPADVVILNPPRAGVAAPVTAALASARASTRAIVYVSCDPATLARDVARLTGWRVASLVSFDMFPQTAHVETVCELVPEAS